MAFNLSPIAVESGYRLAAYDAIGSTSTEALERAKAGDSGRLWVVAREQTAGHGRRGRAWSTPPGNLAASLLLRLDSAASQTATLGFAAGLALSEAIRSSAPGIAFHIALDDADAAPQRVRLKWPNDVLVDGAKVAGILLQASTSATNSSVVIGVGVNVVSAPVGLPYPATSLTECGAGLTAERLFEALSASWVEMAALWDEGRGFNEIRHRWLERAAGLGAPMAVSAGGAVCRGLFETIDAEGRLVIRGSDGSAHHITAGDVHFGAVATVAA